MASIERTAYRRFKRFMSGRELHVFCTPQPDEIVWAGEAAGSDEHLLALVTQLKVFNRLGYFPVWARRRPPDTSPGCPRTNSRPPRAGT